MDQPIALNRKARHDYQIEEEFEAGLVLEGWEVKSLRAHKAQIADSHVVFRNNDAWLLNAHFSPLLSASTHITPEATRTRKLLLHATELKRLKGKVSEKGYTIIPLKLYWQRRYVKITLALAKGKKLYDKRADLKERDWQRQKQRLLKRH